MYNIGSRHRIAYSIRVTSCNTVEISHAPAQPAWAFPQNAEQSLLCFLYIALPCLFLGSKPLSSPSRRGCLASRPEVYSEHHSKRSPSLALSPNSSSNNLNSRPGVSLEQALSSSSSNRSNSQGACLAVSNKTNRNQAGYSLDLGPTLKRKRNKGAICSPDLGLLLLHSNPNQREVAFSEVLQRNSSSLSNSHQAAACSRHLARISSNSNHRHSRVVDSLQGLEQALSRHNSLSELHLALGSSINNHSDNLNKTERRCGHRDKE